MESALATEPKTIDVVYKYGLHRILPESKPAFEEALRGGHQLYNQFIESLRNRLSAIWDLDSPEVKAFRAAIQGTCDERRQIRETIGDLRSSRPAGETASAEHQAQIDKLKKAGDALTAVIEQGWQDLRKMRAEQKTGDQYKEAVKQTATKFPLVSCKNAHVYWSTYDAVRRSAEQASEKTKGLPKFQRYDGTGTVTVQLMTHQNPEEVFGTTHTVLQIDPVDPRAWDSSVPRAERGKLQRTRLRIRVGSDGRRPRWAEFEMIMHRPLPEGARITNASVTRSKHANWDVYSVQITVSQPIPEPLVSPKRIVAIDYGWRQTDDGGLRIGYWADTDGNHGEIRLPGSIRDRLDYTKTKKGQRDENLDALKAGLREDFADREHLDPELRERIKSISQWRAPWKFVRLLKFEDRLPKSARERIEAWHRLDLHNWQIETGVRVKAIGHRNSIYANEAYRLATKYDTVVSENLRPSNLGRKARPERKKDLPTPVAIMRNKSSSQRFEAAVATFRSMLRSTLRRMGKFMIGAPAQNTSRIHAACGNTCNLGPEQVHTCEHCGKVFDRDHNAALNLLARGQLQIAQGLKWPEPRKAKFAARHLTR